MKTTIKFLIVSCLPILLSCGSSHKVITPDGSVYKVEGNSFFRNGNDVTEQLSQNEKETILSTLNQRLEAEKALKERQDELEDTQKKLKKEQKKARKEQQRLEKEIKNKSKAREDFFKAKSKLRDQQEVYKKLIDKGKLSSKEMEKWNNRIKKLQENLDEAERRLNNLN